jgi:hypothetical protein
MVVAMQPRYRLAAFDLDGTLLPEPGGMSEANAAAIRSLVDRGVLVAPATARFYEAAIRPFAAIGIEAPSISCAGADVRAADGRIIAQSTMPAEFARFVAHVCDTHGWRGNLTTTSATYLVERDPPLRANPLPPYLQGVRRAADADLDGLVTALFWAAADDPAVEALAEWAGAVNLRTARANDGSVLLTFTAAGVDKGTGLRLLCEALDLDPSSAVAFGDSDVDLPLFEAAGLAVAMGDGEPEVVARAHHVTPPAREGGVAWGIAKVWGAA